MIRIELHETIFLQRLEGGERVAFEDILGKSVPSRGAASGKALRWTHAWCAKETSRRSVWRDPNEQEEEK